MVKVRDFGSLDVGSSPAGTTNLSLEVSKVFPIFKMLVRWRNWLDADVQVEVDLEVQHKYKVRILS